MGKRKEEEEKRIQENGIRTRPITNHSDHFSMLRSPCP